MHQIRKAHWTERFQKSPYILGAILFHAVLGLFLAYKVILPGAQETIRIEPEVTFIPTLNPSGEKVEISALERPPEVTESTSSESGGTEVQIPSAPTLGGVSDPTVENIIQNNRVDPESFVSTKSDFKPHMGGALISESQNKINQGIQQSNQKLDEDRKKMYQKWYSTGSDTESSHQAVFTIYAGKIEGLSAKKLLTDDRGVEGGGALHNLANAAEAWGRHSMKPTVGLKPLDLGGDEIVEKAPPFVYLSGSRDFKLTDKEVAQLQRYLQQGGAIWADNALAGNGSRFDIAFRREMKRVVGQVPFEVLPIDHPVFQGAKTLFQFSAIPSGMNYRNESFEVIRIDGEIAVLYTPNNYTDMMRMVFSKPLKVRGNEPVLARHDERNSVASTPYLLWNERTTFFRNFEPESSEDALRIGCNIIFHLLTRWSDRLGF